MANQDLKNKSIAFAAHDLIQRYGIAGEEFLKALRGIDNKTGFKYDRSLLDVSNYKINPDYAANNIKQQAGYSAEIVSVAKRNAEAIKKNQSVRYSRSEDLPGYGKNHTVVDIVEHQGGQTTTSQMKFVSDPKLLAKRIAEGEGGGKNDYSRYLTADKIEIPTEQVEQLKQTCREKSAEFAAQAERARLDGKHSLADKLQKNADNYQELGEKVADAKVSTQEAIDYRLNPRWETTKDIAKISHQAGIEGAKFGAAIGGSISLITNIYAVAIGDKDFTEAALDVSKGTLLSAGVGYATTATGAALTTYMGQSTTQFTRQLAKTGLPGMVISTCLATGKSIKRFVAGEIDSTQLLDEMGGFGVGMVSGSLFSVIGQIAIPVPILGALIGGMVGCTLSNMFYRNFMDALNGAKLAAERRRMIEMQCEAARMIAEAYEMKINELFDRKLIQLDKESTALFNVINSVNITIDEYCDGMNRFAEVLGKKLTINNIKELDDVMLSDEPLVF